MTEITKKTQFDHCNFGIICKLEFVICNLAYFTLTTLILLLCGN